MRAGAAYEAARRLEMMGKENDLSEAHIALASLENEIESLKEAVEVLIRKSPVSAD
jgi:hypothetical protein